MEHASECPKCGGALAPGFVLDRTTAAGGAGVPSKWQEGAPERSIWTGVKLHPDDQHAITTFRCDRCGFLESYAA